MIRNWRRIVKRLKRVVSEVLGDARVYVFGSVVSDEYTCSSDIDVLIVSKNIPGDRGKRIELEILIEDMLGIDPLGPNPLEIHLATPEESRWYFKILGIKYMEV